MAIRGGVNKKRAAQERRSGENRSGLVQKVPWSASAVKRGSPPRRCPIKREKTMRKEKGLTLASGEDWKIKAAGKIRGRKNQSRKGLEREGVDLGEVPFRPLDSSDLLKGRALEKKEPRGNRWVRIHGV